MKQKKNKFIGFRLSEDELEVVKLKAKEVKMTVSKYIRYIILGK